MIGRRADFSRTCKGCECVRSVPWPVKGRYSEETIAFRCFAPGKHKGTVIGIERLVPYIPAWCPLMQEKGE